MNPREFIDLYGVDEAGKVAVAAGSKLSYFRQLATGHRRPSVKLAQALVNASGGRLDFVSLLITKPIERRSA